MLSIKNSNKYEETIKYSKFISLIFRVYNEEEVKKIINDIKKEYPSATHYCYAYIIENNIKSSDDGEPSKTAGIPILNQILGNNLNYTLIVVIRYFGGIKLGTGLLTRTYAKVAKEVITKDNIIELVKGYNIDITFNYDNTKDIDYILSNSKIISKIYNNDITYNALVTEETLNKLNNYKVIINNETYIEKE
ncbi:MAG: IMPACT family protein [Bacilli bacterium]